MTAIRDLAIDEVLDIPALTARAAARWGERTALSFDATDEHLLGVCRGSTPHPLRENHQERDHRRSR